MVYDPDAQPRTIVLTDDGAGAIEYQVPEGVALKVESVVADVSALLADAQPTLKIVAPGGVVIAEKRQSDRVETSITFGTATWALRLADDGAGLGALAVGALVFNNGQTITTGGTIPSRDVTFTTVAFDTDGMADLAANNERLTVRTAGIYLLVARWQWTGAWADGNFASTGITLNGNNIAASFNAGSVGPGGPALSQPVSAVENLAVGDFVGMHVGHNSGVNRTGLGRFAAIRLGAGP